LEKKIILKEELKKYRKPEQLLHHFFAIVFVLLFLTGFLKFAGAGAIFGAAHIVSGYIFLALFFLHIIYLVVQGISKDIPVDEIPFYIRFSEIGKYLRGEKERYGKFSFPERFDYLSLMILSTVACVTGLFLRLPQFIPGMADVTTVYSISKIHYFTGIAISFWVFGYHLYFTVIQPLPGNAPSNIFGKDITPENVLRFRPRWYESLERNGIIETVEERVDKDKVDREKVTALLSEGNEFFKRGDYHRAEILYLQAIDLYPSYSQAQYNLAMLYIKTGETGKAIREYRRFLEIDPFNPLASQVKRKLKELGDGE
jgi:cytochrome b subunit of formate dehydrogenase